MVILMSVPGMSACTIWTMSLSRTKNGTLRDFANLSILVWKMVREIYSFLNIYIYIYIYISCNPVGLMGVLDDGKKKTAMLQRPRII